MIHVRIAVTRRPALLAVEHNPAEMATPTITLKNHQANAPPLMQRDVELPFRPTRHRTILTSSISEIYNVFVSNGERNAPEGTCR